MQPSHSDQEQQLREQLQAMLDAARNEIEQALALITFTQRDDENAEQISSLEDQLKTLDTHSSNIAAAPLNQLQQMQVSLPRSVNAVRSQSNRITADAGIQHSAHITEMSLEQIHALQQAHDAQSHAFYAYEAQSASHIGQLAAANGADITGYQMNRARIQADIEQAKQNGDRVGAFKGEALLASNNVFGLIKAGGAEADIEEAKQKAAEARQRYLKEKEIEARQSGMAQGLKGDALKAHVDQASQTAAAQLDAENARNAERAGLTTEQAAQAGVSISAARHVDKEQRNQLSQSDGKAASFATQTAASPSQQQSDRREEQATQVDMHRLLDGNKVSLSSDISVIDVDDRSPKQPVNTPEEAKPAQQSRLG